MRLVICSPNHPPRAEENVWALTGRSCAGSVAGPLRPLTCSGLGVAVTPAPCKDVIELLTLLEGVDTCCTAPFSLTLPFELWKEDCDPGMSFVAWPFSPACFLLLKRNAIVPCAAEQHFYISYFLSLCWRSLLKLTSMLNRFVWIRSSEGPKF